MQRRVIQRVLGILLAGFSVTMLPPILVGTLYEDDAMTPFLLAFAITLITGLILWYPVRKSRDDLRLRDGFLIVVLFWTVLGAFGALPLLFCQSLTIGITDAVFESISGLTTTGATVITNLDELPKSILFYRQGLQWLGGMGIIVLAVAILPMLGVGGMQLYRAETPGPVKDSKLTPRIKETAKALWYIYLSLTVACALGYWLAGMNVFDAISHSFSTVAIGGFSTHNESIGYFRSAPIETVSIIFMLLSGVNFGLHFITWKSQGLRHYLRDTEFKTYFIVIISISIIAAIFLRISEVYLSWDDAFAKAIFHAVSIATTTGFTTSHYYFWPSFLPLLLLLASFIGGCTGSTGGGMKVIRVYLLVKQGSREMLRLIHPNAKIAVKIGSKAVDGRVIEAVWGFFSAYMGVFIIMLLLLVASGLDQVTAFSAVTATLNNLGPGLGEVGANYTSINDFSKWVLCLGMLLGRLEIFTLLVVLTPAFWRR
ncbi:MAG: TrkH family potassium uptake protein [Gammaproteobacteria bacterium]|nr:TrkH family potassium uptake protein [Gammaproteobacteria bacterium]